MGQRLSRWRVLVALLGAVAVLAAAPTAYAGESRIGINGARPSELPIVSDILGGAGFTQDGWLTHATHVGENWLPGMTPVPLNYPAQLGPLWGLGARTGDQSLTAGQQALHTAILAELDKGNTVSIAGLSLGTMVIDREIAYLHGLSEVDAPNPDDITFYIFGGESRGFGQTYARGVTIPIIGVTFHSVPETRYNTVVVYAQWDGWANTPDRPWNVLSVANAVMGALYTVNGSNDHSSAATKDLSDAILVSDITNGLGGNTKTYMIPESSLPITRPLRQLGVPDWAVDRLNALLLPWIATGYSSMTPELGLHIANGQLRWTVPASSEPEAPAAPLASDRGAPTGTDTADTVRHAPTGTFPERKSTLADESERQSFGAEESSDTRRDLSARELNKLFTAEPDDHSGPEQRVVPRKSDRRLAGGDDTGGGQESPAGDTADSSSETPAA